MLNKNHMPKSWLFPVVLILAVCLQTGWAEAGKPQTRDGWLVGLSYGYSAGHIAWSTETEGSYKGGATPQMRFGKMISKSVALGLDYHGWMLEKGEVPVKLRSSLQSVSLTATWYPGHGGSALDGFYLRGGGGFAWAGITFIEIDEEPQDHVPLSQEHGTRFDETGLGLNFQAGYEFRVSKSFAAGLGLGFNYLSIGREFYDTAYYFPVTLTGIWYLN